MQIIPNFIEDKEIQQNIKHTLLEGRRFGYNYCDTVGSDNDYSDFYFVHMLYLSSSISDTGETKVSSTFNDILSPLIGRLKFNYLIRGKVNLYTKKPEPLQTEMHRDFPKSHMVGLYSVNTNNGYTLFKDGTRAESVENQMVIFDGNIEHCSVAQTDTNVRVNININFQ